MKPVTVSSIFVLGELHFSAIKQEIFWHYVIINFFWYWLVSLFKFSYWSKFHDNTITGSVVMIVDFYKVLTRNSEIGYTPDWVFPNMWRLGQVRNTKFGMNLSNKMLLHAAKYQSYSFYYFWVINSIQNEGRGVKRSPLPVLSL